MSEFNKISTVRKRLALKSVKCDHFLFEKSQRYAKTLKPPEPVSDFKSMKTAHITSLI